MNNLNSELKQHALMKANAIRRLHRGTGLEVREAQLAYRRVKEFPLCGNVPICPLCWVKGWIARSLKQEADSREAVFLKCIHCGFQGVFSKPDHAKYPAEEN